MDSTTDAIKKKSYKFFVKGKKSKGFSIFFFFFFFCGGGGGRGCKGKKNKYPSKVAKNRGSFQLILLFRTISEWVF